MKGVYKTDGDLISNFLFLLNKKWEQDLAANLFYISGCD